MKIVYYSPHPDLSLHSPSGYGTHMREMIKAFEDAGHEVIPLIMGDGHGAATPARTGLRKRDIAKTFIPPLVWESVKDLALARMDRGFESALTERLRDIQPDLVYERAAYLQASGVRAARRCGIPHCLEMNSPYLEENRVLRNAHSIMESRARAIEGEQITATTCTAVVSAGLIDYFVEHHGVSPDRFIVTPNGIDPETVRCNAERVESLRAQYGTAGETVIGFVGSIIAWQRVDLLIEAFARLCRRHDRLKLLIVGDSPLAADLKARCTALGISDRVLFPGRVDHHDVYQYIGLMDIAVLPDNLWYGSPTKIFEYGALGKAIVAPANRTMAQLIADGEEGLLVAPQADAIADAIGRLIELPEARFTMAANFQAKVLSAYTWRHNVERVLEAIADAVHI